MWSPGAGGGAAGGEGSGKHKEEVNTRELKPNPVKSLVTLSG